MGARPWNFEIRLCELRVEDVGTRSEGKIRGKYFSNMEVVQGPRNAH